MFLPIVAVVGLIVGADVGDIVGLTKLFVVETEEESVGGIVTELTGTIVDGVLEGLSVGSMDDVADNGWIDAGFVGDTEVVDVVRSCTNSMQDVSKIVDITIGFSVIIL